MLPNHLPKCYTFVMAEISGESPLFPLTSHEMEGVVHDLGPNGTGITKISGIISEKALQSVQAELGDQEQVKWRDNRGSHVNARGANIVQNYDVFALKLRVGEQSIREKLPVLMGLVGAIENLVANDLAEYFHVLQTWQADEASVHRYDPGRVGISHHYDQTRFWGVIPMATLDGERELSVIGHHETQTVIDTTAGDLLLMRAPGLYASPASVDIRPKHAVDNRHIDDGSTSLLLRADKEFDRQHDGFSYHNWPDPAES
jgi:hypothetical protein